MNLYKAFRQRGFQIAPGLLIASTGPLFALSQELAALLASNVPSFEGKACAKQHGRTGRGAMVKSVCEFGKAGSMLPHNGTVSGSLVLWGTCSPSSGRFS